MRYIKAKFVNYIGFYNGMNLDEVEIDFTKCQHKIVLITGKNGSGKSTLLSHLNPFPDGSSSFIPDKSASKELVLESNGDIYEISLISPADLKGRKTTKAYIKKNGIELNENGNVSSYKDIIFSEFELDSNYISLSNLSSTDRGLGDKTPAERKKFVANIIDNLEIYNNMYKALNKKSLIYKSHIGTLHTKIQNIGDKSVLEQRLANLRVQESTLSANIMDCNNQIVALQAKNSIDENEAKEIQSNIEAYEALDNECKLLGTTLDNYYHKTKIKREDVTDKLAADKELLSGYKSKQSEVSAIWKEKSNRLSDVSSQITSISAEVESAKLDDSISSRYEECKNKINDLFKELSDLKIEYNDSTQLELYRLSRVCDKFCTLIDSFYQEMIPADIEFVVKEFTKDTIPNFIAKQQDIIHQMDSINAEISDLQSDIKVLAILESRPKNCKIDSCAFISDAIKLRKSIKEDPADRISALQDKLLALSATSSEIQELIDYSNTMYPKSMKLDEIRRLVSENIDILNKYYPNFADTLDTMICNMSPFNDFRDNSRVTDGINICILLSSELQNKKVLDVEYEAFKDKVKFINSSKVMLENFKAEEESLIKEISDLKSQVDGYNNIIESLSINISTEQEYSNKVAIYNDKLAKANALNATIESFNKKSSKAMESLSIINTLNSNISTYNAELNPVKQEISTITGELTLVDSYYKEYEEYSQSYKVIETLKKYCSPTGGGIQTLFMQLYMSKTKELANEVLAMLFGGNYRLLDFIINDSEFRIPFIGEGLPVDDISSGSSAQVSMMSMIINLVLLHQGSSKFNIAMLDEINAALDGYNNAIFVNVILQCMEILQIDQLFMISHSIDTDGSFADVIKLKGYDNYEFNVSGNVIFDYNNCI